MALALKTQLLPVAGCILALLVLGSSVARADPEECREAIDRYNRALSDVSDGVRSYTGCVSVSRAHDDCSSEFLQLHSAQDDFETAVSEYESECQ
jgi:hypothetical protein